MPTFTWRDGTSGDWSNAANWAGDELPGGSDTASVTGAGGEIITIDQAVTAAALTLEDASATLIIAGSLLLTGDGDTAASSGSALNDGTVILRGTLDLGGGTLTVGAGSAGVIELANGGTIVNGTINQSFRSFQYRQINAARVRNGFDRKAGLRGHFSPSLWDRKNPFPRTGIFPDTHKRSRHDRGGSGQGFTRKHSTATTRPLRFGSVQRAN
jgi:hypothetical protein